MYKEPALIRGFSRIGNRSPMTCVLQPSKALEADPVLKKRGSVSNQSPLRALKT